MNYNPNGRIFLAALTAKHPDPLQSLLAGQRDREQAAAQATATARQTAKESTSAFIRAITGTPADTTTQEETC